MKIFWLARTNNSRYKKYSRSYFFSLTFASILFLFFISISCSIQKIYNSVTEEDFYLKQIKINPYILDENDKPSKSIIDDNLINILSNNDYVDQVSVKHILLQSKNITIEHNDYNVPIISWVDGVNPKFKTFSKTEVDEVKKEYGFNGDIIIAGRDFNKEDKKSTLIDENFVYILGYSNVFDIVGTKIKITRGNEIVEDITIIGVIDYRFGPSPSSRFDAPPHTDFEYIRETGWYHPLILSSDVINTFTSENINNRLMSTGQRSIFIDVLSIRNVEYVYDLISKYTNNSVESQLQDSRAAIEQLDNISVFILIFSSIILIISFVSLVNSAISKVHAQKRFLKMVMIIGYNKQDIIKLYVYDHLITFIKSSIIYIGSIYLITIMLESILQPYYTLMTSNLSSVFIVRFDTICIYTVLLLVVTILITFITTNTQVTKQLKAGNV